MSRAPRRQRTMNGRRLSLEWLEARWLPAGSAATMASGAITFVRGVSWNAAQNSVTIDFNQGYVDGVFTSNPVQLQPENPDNPTPVLGNPTYVDTPTDTLDTIPVTGPLQPGVYDILLLNDGDTESIWGSLPSPPQPTPPVTLGELTIAPPPVVNPPATLSNATAKGAIGTQTIGSQEQTIINGSLDLSSQENVDLYAFTLGPGHFWRLGAQLEAQQIGTPLRGALTLFDSSGNALATSDAGTGGFDSPADPYLFSGLKPGLYYIGVSGAGNLGEQPGGYDPRGEGTFGTSGSQQAGGDYTLDLFADPADTPTRVVGAELQWGDPLVTSPTGLVLDFSGSIDVNSLSAAANKHSAIWAVDQSGRTWFLTPTGYDASLAQMSFVFDQPLPPGEYTLLNSSVTGLKDLAGLSPVAPGLPQGVLATWTVPPPTPAVLTGIPPVVWPAQQDGVAGSELIPPGQVATSRVFVPAQGLYNLLTSVSQGTLAIERSGPDGLVVVDPGSPGASHQYTLDLEPGLYVFTFRNLGTQNALAGWQIAPSSIDHENLTDNGVGQSVALSLRWVTPTFSNLTTDSPTGSSQAPESMGAVSAAAPPQETAGPSAPSPFTLAFAAPTLIGLSASSGGVSPLPGSLFVTVDSGLMGSPTAGGGPIEAVGPTVPGGMLALANGASGLLSGIAGRWNGTAEDGDLAQSGLVPLTNGSPAPAAALAAEPSPASSGDAVALAKADRITELAGRLGRFLGLKTGEEGAAFDSAAVESDLLARIEKEPGRGPASGAGVDSREKMTEADLGMPTGLIVVAAAAYRLRQLAGRWWRRACGEARLPSRPEVRPTGPGPWSFHGSQGIHAARTRVRTPRRC